MVRKRKHQSRAGGGGDVSRQKRRAVEAETANPTRTEETPTNSDKDAPEVDEIIKVELGAEASSEEGPPTQPEIFGDYGNLDLALDLDIEIGEVTLMQIPKDDVVAMDSNMVAEVLSSDPNIGGSVHIFPYTLKPSDLGRGVTPTRCRNEIGGDENSETSLPISTDLLGANENDIIEDISAIQEKDGEITRLKGELQAAMDRNEFLQRQVNSKDFRIEELSSKIKLSENEIQNLTAVCKWLKGELYEAKSETEKLRLELYTKNTALERQTSQTGLLDDPEHSKLAQKNSRTVEEFPRQLIRKSEVPKNTILEKTSVVERQSGESTSLQEQSQQPNSEKKVIRTQARENNRLQDEHANLRRHITDKDAIIHKHTVKVDGLQKDLKRLVERPEKEVSDKVVPANTSKMTLLTSHTPAALTTPLAGVVCQTSSASTALEEDDDEDDCMIVDENPYVSNHIHAPRSTQPNIQKVSSTLCNGSKRGTASKIDEIGSSYGKKCTPGPSCIQRPSSTNKPCQPSHDISGPSTTSYKDPPSKEKIPPDNLTDKERYALVLEIFKKFDDKRVPIIQGNVPRQRGRPAKTVDWRCTYCPKTLKSKRDFQDHLAAHVQTKHISCSFPGCTSASTSSICNCKPS